MHPSHHRRSAVAIGATLALAPTIFVACRGGTAAETASGPGGRSLSVADRSSLPAIKWGPAPAVFPPGAQMAVIQGDPGKSEPFIVRLRFPNGYAIAPHTHPTDEYITVIDGRLKVGMGAAFDEAAMAVLPAGSFATAPALHAHYAKAQGVTTVQINAVGPFALDYVNPNDLPKQAAR
jgi:quercetin dioxygenase-like cupin family protein